MDVRLYALSTCGWCKKTKLLLKELGVDHTVIEVDVLPYEQKERVREEVNKYNPDGTFPTLVVDEDTVIVGFKEDEIREALADA